MLPSAPKPLKTWPRKWELRSSPNFISWYPSCRNYRRETHRSDGRDPWARLSLNGPRWSRSPPRLDIRSRREAFAFGTPIGQSVTERPVGAVEAVAGLVATIYLLAVSRKRREC